MGREQELELYWEIYKGASPHDLQIANKRFMVVNQFLRGESYSQIGISQRTIRSWVERYRDAEKRFNDGYVGLIPIKRKSGNRIKYKERNIIEQIINIRIIIHIR
ncbi:MAG: helix-turn-helix domain-containing protein [Bacillota bacterium]